MKVRDLCTDTRTQSRFWPNPRRRTPVSRSQNKTNGGGHYIIERFEKVKQEGSLRDALHTWLYRTPINGSMPDMPDDDKNIDTFLCDYLKNQEAAAEEHIQTVLADQGVEFEAPLRQRYEGMCTSDAVSLISRSWNQVWKRILARRGRPRGRQAKNEESQSRCVIHRILQRFTSARLAKTFIGHNC